MKKRDYVAPSMEVVEIQGSLLAGSGENTRVTGTTENASMDGLGPSME